MQITLFDACSGFGGATPGETAVVSADDLVAEMQRLDVARALVRIVPEDLDSDVIASNTRLFAACASHPTLLPCPIVLPVPPEEEQIAVHARRGAGAVWIRPAADYWSLAPWVADRLFHALEQRRLPVLVLESMVDLDRVGELASRYPALRILLAGITYRQQRVLVPLLKAFPNVHLVLGATYAVHGGLEEIVAEVGATRVLFGTNFPRTEPMTAITYLMYSALGAEEKQLIGATNLERLIGEVVR